MSQWTHSICYGCWLKKDPNSDPARLKQESAEVETCCYCGNETREGIYLRDNPNNTICKGEHKDD